MSNSNISFVLGSQAGRRGSLNVHKIVEEHLEELNQIFEQEIFDFKAEESSSHKKLVKILQRKLGTKSIDRNNPWSKDSILYTFSQRNDNEEIDSIKDQLREISKTLNTETILLKSLTKEQKGLITLVTKMDNSSSKRGGTKYSDAEVKEKKQELEEKDQELNEKKNIINELEKSKESLEEKLSQFQENINDDIKKYKSLGEIISSTPAISNLYFEFMRRVDTTYHGLDFNSRILFAYDKTDFKYSGVVSYMVCCAYFLREISTIDALMNYVTQKKLSFGVNGTYKNIYDYLVTSSTRKIIDTGKHCFSGRDKDDFQIYNTLRNQEISLHSTTFSTRLDKLFFEYKESGQEYLELIQEWNSDHDNPQIQENEKRSVVQQLKKFNNGSDTIEDEEKLFKLIPSILFQIKSNPSMLIGETNYSELMTSDEDFDVEFIVDDQSVTEVNASNVKCAAQLFYSMTLGDELEVFNVVNFLTHKYLVRGGMEIKDRKLRENLQLYVFSNKFIDSRTNREMEKTRPAERQMFYKQVFNYGNSVTTDDLIVNSEFTRLWKVLIVESAKYLERAQDSPNPMNFVSKQNVMQTVEDLQYNLSMHCSGMVNVITPIIYQELRFVINNILNHEEIRRQVVPAGGSWWKVVENLYAAMRSRRMKTTVVNNKAKIGHDIIRSISEYNPSTFENDRVFGSFISNVDSFITTQSILQESAMEDIKEIDKEEVEMDDTNEKIASNGHVPVTAGDEWDF